MRIVLADGAFDLFHVGHLRYLRNAALYGDFLQVSVTKDANVTGKGPNKPIIKEDERLEIVRSLKCVNNAALYSGCLDAMAELKPDVFVKGHDWKVRGLPQYIVDYCNAHSIEIAFTPENLQTTGRIIGAVLKAVA